MPRTINNNGKKKKHLSLPAGLDETPKFIQSKESADEYINTPLAVSSDTVLVKGNLLVEGEVKSKGETLTGDNSEAGDITGISFITQDASVITHTSGAPAIGVQGSNGISTTNPSTDVIQINGTSASTSLKGVVELATTAETTTGTDTDRAVTPDGLKDGYQGSSNIETVGDLDSGAITSGFGNIDNGTSTLATGEITSGAVVWESFPFIVSNGVAGNPYYRDVDDLYGDFRKWDDYDTSPTLLTGSDIPGQFCVPENCTLKAMRAVVTNWSQGDDIQIHIYHGTPNLDSISGTTLAQAGSTTTISVGTARYIYAGSDTSLDVDLDAGDIVVPMVEHNSTAGNCTLRGNITLKFLTR